MKTVYCQPYEKYTVIAQQFEEGGRISVMINQHNGATVSAATLVEKVLTEHHAIKGAERLPIFYEIAKSKGYRLIDGYFTNGNRDDDLHASHAMDLDQTEERFASLLK